jgi:glycosyltransferase involved in cell wall biosynthesis
MTIDNPKITIVTVTYNAEQYLERTIKSVISQNYSNIEYIIIDGASTDGTIDIIKKYEQYITYWVSEPDKGIYDAMNKSIDVATGEWINFMNAGDSYTEHNPIDFLINYFSTNIGMLYGGINIVNDSSSKYISPLDLSYYTKKMPCCHQSIFFNLNIIKNYRFNTTYKINADLDLILRIYKDNYKYKYFDIPFVNFLSDGYHTIDKPRGFLDELYVTSKYLTKCDMIYEHESYQLIKYYEPNTFNTNLGLSFTITKIVNQLDIIASLYSKIVIYGDGSLCKLIKPFLKNKIVKILDLSPKTGDHNVIHPQEINTLDYEIILISLLGREAEVTKTLISYGVSQSKLKYFEL